MHRKFRLLAAVSVLPAAVPALAQQQVVPSDASATLEQSRDQSAGGDIVVTASRRTESLRDVPISVVALGQQALETKGVRNIADVTRLTPGVNFSPSWAGSSNISIRGVSSRNGAATTGIYLDDTPIQARALGAAATSTNAYPAIFDLERVEVLRGPQGTLFGAGSEGGTIRFIIPKPGLSKYSGYGRAELGFTKDGDPSYEAGAAVGGPIIEDKIGFRVSGYYRRDGGWVDRVPAGGAAEAGENNANSATTRALRGAVTFAPTERLELTPSIFYQLIKRADTDQYWRQLSTPKDTKFFNGNPLAQPNRDRLTLYALNGRYDLGGIDLVSSTSFLDRRNTLTPDYTVYLAEIFSTPFALLPTNVRATSPNLNTQRSFSQEVRLQSSDNTSPLNWVVGAFYQNARQMARQRMHAIPSVSAFEQAVFGGPLPIPPLPGENLYQAIDYARDKQTAIFGQLDYKIGNVTLTAGGRYAWTKFSSTNETSGPLGGELITSEATQKEKPFTPKFGIKYEPDSNFMVYASATKGFRVGGSNLKLPGGFTAVCAQDIAALGADGLPNTYRSDSVWSYEGGAKGRLGRGISFEASVFRVDWKNIQSLATLQCGWNFIDNLGSARSEGFDARVTLQPVDGLTLEGGVARTNAKYTNSVSVGDAPFVKKGDRLSTPPWSVNLAGDYEFNLGGQLEGYAHADYQYQSGYSVPATVTGFSFDTLDPHRSANHFVSMRVGLRKNDVDLSVFVQNLMNAHYILASVRDVPTSSLVRDSTYRPRTVGITASVRY